MKRLKCLIKNCDNQWSHDGLLIAVVSGTGADWEMGAAAEISKLLWRSRVLLEAAKPSSILLIAEILWYLFLKSLFQKVLRQNSGI